MKLYYKLPDELEAKIKAAVPGEVLLYSLPFDEETDGKEFLENAFTVISQTKLFLCKNLEIIECIPLCELSDFHTEMLYGTAGFFAKKDGKTRLICRFVSGKHLARYTIVANACEELAKNPLLPAVENDEPEHFCPICGRKYLRGTNFCPHCRKKSEIYKKLWELTKGMRLILLFPLLSAAITLILRFVTPAFQAIAINDYIVPVSGIPGPIKGFLAVVAAIIFFDLFSRALGVIQGRISAISGNKFTLRLRCMMFAKLQDLSMSAISTKTTGDMMGRINEDVNIVQNFITNLLPNYFSQLFSFVVSLVILIWMNPLMCLFVFIPLPIAIFAIIRFWKHMQLRWRKEWMLRRSMQNYLQDSLNGIRVIKNYGNEAQAIYQFGKRADRHAKQGESNGKTFDTFFPIIGFILRLGNYLILFYGNILLFNGAMLVGDLNQFNSYTGILYEPLMQINQIPRNIIEFFTSFSKIIEVLEESSEMVDTDDPVDLTIKGEVSVQDVTFGYDTYNPVLQRISVEVKPGEMLGIVGLSGSGKTTLINLIMRLYDPSRGRILIDGINIRDLSQTALRSQIGVVLQETHLFSGSIRDNIRYSKPDATNAEIISAAKLAGAHDFIMALPEGYNSIVGEKGYSLSGGERQRIAIARALIHNPSILILDEATAALDTETEKQIQDAINTATVGRTTIAIAHRLSTLRGADKLLVLDHGRVAEFGTHRELLEKRGIYYKLVMAQTEAAIAKGETA